MQFTYSVVIPTYDRVPYLLQAVDSAWAQTHPPHEVIVVVDGDVDGVARAVREHSPATRVVVLEQNRGVAGARRAGAAAAEAEWVAFLDDDDLWHRDKQETLRQYLLVHPVCEAVRPGFWLFEETAGSAGGAFGMRPELEGSTLPELESAAGRAAPVNDLSYLDIEGDSLGLMLERNRGAMSGSVIRRELLRSLPPVPDDVAPCDDWMLFIHVAARAEWHYVPERLVFTRLHPGQLTRSREEARKTSGKVLDVLTQAWDRYGDRPGIDLDRYRREYRDLVQAWIWQRLLAGDVPGAVSTYRRARWLVPKGADRLFVWAPRQVTWRLVHRRLR